MYPQFVESMSKPEPSKQGKASAPQAEVIDLSLSFSQDEASPFTTSAEPPPPFAMFCSLRDSGPWSVRYQTGKTKIITVAKGSCTAYVGKSYSLLNSSPMSFRWGDGTTQRLMSVVNGCNVKWSTDHPLHPLVLWEATRLPPRGEEAARLRHARKNSDKESAEVREECEECEERNDELRKEYDLQRRLVSLDANTPSRRSR